MLNSSVCFVGDKAALSFIDKLIHEDGLIDDMVVSFDTSEDNNSSDMVVYKCETDDHNWVDISKISDRILEKYPELIFEVIYASTDTESYVDVISSDGTYDVYVDSDPERAAEICKNYNLEFFEEDVQEDYTWDDEEEYDSDY